MLQAIGDRIKGLSAHLPTGGRLRAAGIVVGIYLLLAVLLGGFGLHRFYVGRKKSGLVWLLTGGVFFVGWIYDILLVATGELVDGEGNRVVYWRGYRDDGGGSSSAHIASQRRLMMRTQSADRPSVLTEPSRSLPYRPCATRRSRCEPRDSVSLW